MRFITWPTLTNSFIVFIGILPSLIPAVNAIVGNVNFVSPSSGGDTFYIGQESEIIWYVSKGGLENRTGRYDTSLMTGISGTSTTLTSARRPA
jgi:hypothetical protein